MISNLNNLSNLNNPNKNKIKFDDIIEYQTHNFEEDEWKYTVEVADDFTNICYWDWNESTKSWEKKEEMMIASNMAYLIAKAIVKDVDAINGVVPSITYRGTGIVDTNPCETPSDWTRNISTGDYPQGLYPTITTATSSKATDTVKRA